MTDRRRGPAHGTDCETIDDCELPTETYQRHSNGETVVCPNCGREWVHKDGWFTQTGRRVTGGCENGV